MSAPLPMPAVGVAQPGAPMHYMNRYSPHSHSQENDSSIYNVDSSHSEHGGTTTGSMKPRHPIDDIDHDHNHNSNPGSQNSHGSPQLEDGETDAEANVGDEDHDHEHEHDDELSEFDDGYDEEPVKLFVGQVPKSMDEADLFPIFEEYGPMEDVAIIRDKHTGQHRGCAFVTYLNRESADACERELHNTLPFEDGKRPVQVRPAGKKEENKVFVGMLPRNVTEEMVTDVFQSYGKLSGVFVIKSTDGYRKGCSFVKFVNRNDALSAIKDLNGKCVFEGSDRPLIVKIADTKGEKRMRMNRKGDHHQGSMPGMSGGSVYGSDTASESPQINGHGNNMYFMPSPAPPGHLTLPPPHLYPTQVGIHAPPHTHASTSFSTYPTAAIHGHSNGSPLPSDYMYPPQQLPPPPHSHYMADHPQHVNALPPSYPRPARNQQPNAGRPREGPAGANLFIYHLPHDLTDADLATAFNPFGNVISAKVYVDKYTGESKGFGFVSYDSIISAEQAIELMNGFQIGNKRLKVQHKRVHHRQAAAPLPNVATNVHSYYHHPVPGPGHMMHNHGHNPNHTQHHPMLYHDVPVPSIEIESKADDNASTFRTLSSINTTPVGQNDIDNLTQSFSGLNADDRNGNV